MYLVTGGAGFIGSHVVDRLLARGDKVLCLDNLNDYYPAEVKLNNIQHQMNHPDFEFLRGDIRDAKLMKELHKYPIENIIHLAAMAGVRNSIAHPKLYEKVNVGGTMNMLNLAKDLSVKNFVFASSSSVYGNNKKVPFSESDNVDNPISPYAATKKAGELMAYTYHHLYHLPVSCLRFFTVYGPRGRPDMAPLKFTRLIDSGKPIEVYGDGTSQRDYTYIDDIVSGIIAASDIPHPYEIFNLGNNKPVRLDYFISLIERNLGKKAQIMHKPKQEGDVDITYADISKAESLLGYKPKVSIEEGIERLVRWHKGQ
ncbi:MAG: GDP-mannose 4,6-dehydratase [Candidatus Woesearchaeota archaeon]